MNDSLTEQQIKNIKKVETAGRSTEGLGWLVIAFAPLTVFVNNIDFGVGIFIWICSIFIGIYFIYAGKYILYSDGTFNRVFLWVTFFLSLIYIGGIIPLIVSIQSIIAIVAYGKLVKQLGSPNREYKSLPLKTKEIVIFVVIVIVGGTVLFMMKDTLNSNSQKAIMSNSQTGL